MLRGQIRLLLFFLVVATACVTKTINALEIKSTPVSVISENVVLKGFRYLNRDGQFNEGPPALVLHGIGAPASSLGPLINLAMNDGYDTFAFHFRGHGDGPKSSDEGERSYVPSGDLSAYRFEFLVNEDFPEMIAAVIRISGKPGVRVIGHSMGGMIALAASNRLRHGDLHSIVTLASPPHFRDIDDRVKGLVKQFGYTLNSKRFPAEVGFGSLTQGKFSRFFLDAIERTLRTNKQLKAWHQGLINLDHLDKGELSASFSGRLFPLPRDLIRSFVDYFGPEGYPYEREIVRVPSLHIAGAFDTIAPAAAIADHVQSQIQQGAPAHYLTLPEVSHLDIASRRIVLRMTRDLSSFLRNPAFYISARCALTCAELKRTRRIK